MGNKLGTGRKTKADIKQKEEKEEKPKRKQKTLAAGYVWSYPPADFSI